MKTKVKLYGKLAKLFREEYEFFNINTGTNIASAINCVSPKFKAQIIRDQSEGVHYEILINGQTVNCKEEFFLNQVIKTVEVVPIILGAGFAVAAGALMAYAGATGAIFAAGTIGATMLFTFGVGLALAGLVYMMSAPDAIDPVDQEASVKGESYFFSTTRNVATQGSAVPLGYGTLRVGSKVIGNTIRNIDADSEEQPEPVDTRTNKQRKSGGKRSSNNGLAGAVGAAGLMGGIIWLGSRPTATPYDGQDSSLTQSQRFVEAFRDT